MTIKTKQTKEYSVEIELPKFWQNINSFNTIILGIIDEKNAVQIAYNDSYTTIAHREAWLYNSEITTAVSEKWEEITEQEFLEAHQKTLDNLSLVPKLVMADPDDLKGVIPMDEVTQEIENELNSIP